jgi:aryl-alcohol dehydrogenase-like predicted oxidoreductase
LIDQRAHDVGLLQTAQDRGIAVIARTPLCFGYLTGKLSGAEMFSELDHRANWPDGQLKRWAQSPGLFDHLCARRHCTPSQLALLFCLSPGAVATTIPGMMSLAEVEDDVAAADLAPLDLSEIEEIRAIYQANTFYDPSAKQKAVR